MANKTIALVGSAGAVGLRLSGLLEARPDWNVLEIQRDTPQAARDDALSRADLAVLCLPDTAAREFTTNAPKTLRILDASSAHRLHPDWVYGLPELAPQQPTLIQSANRVSNPGCFATGAVLILAPLAHLLRGYPVSISAIGGYTSGGKRMTAEHDLEPFGYRMYGLDLNHRHVREIRHHGGLHAAPIFIPGIGNHPQGTMVQVPLHLPTLGISVLELSEIYVDRYRGSNVRLRTSGGKGYLDGSAMANEDGVQLHVLSDLHGESAVVVANFDNLGKGSAGAALKNIELMLAS